MPCRLLPPLPGATASCKLASRLMGLFHALKEALDALQPATTLLARALASWQIRAMTELAERLLKMTNRSLAVLFISQVAITIEAIKGRKQV